MRTVEEIKATGAAWCTEEELEYICLLADDGDMWDSLCDELNKQTIRINKLEGMLRTFRELLNTQKDKKCLGEVLTLEGMCYPVIDEIIDSITKVLTK